MRAILVLVVALCWAIAAGGGGGGGGAVAADRLGSAAAGRPLVVGRVTTNPRKEFGQYKLFGDYLASRLGGTGIAGAQVLFARDKAEMAGLLREGRVDVVAEAVFAALDLAETAGAELLLREWRGGVPSHHAILFARRDSGIASLADLAGRRIAFEDPGSATSYVLPRAALEAAGHRLAELSAEAPTVPPVPSGAVGYVFAGEEINVTTWVHKGRADAGALGDGDWDDPERVPPAAREDLRIFHRTEPVPRSVLLVRGDLPGPVKARIAEVLVAAHTDPEGRSALKGYRGVTRYDELTGEAAAGIEAARRVAAGLRVAAAPR